MKINKRIASLIAVAGCAATILAACGSSNNATTSATTTKAASSSESGVKASATFPITIKHAFGETVIKEQPKNVVTIAWENEDAPLALGVAPVGVSAANYGLVTEHKLHPWADDAFKKLGVTNPVVFNDTDGLDFEAIANAKPDVILASYSGITQEEYDKLSQIAPVVAYPGKAWQTFWRDQTIINGTALGLETEAKALVSDTEKLINEKVASHPELKDKKAAFMMIMPNDLSSFYVYLPTDPRAAYLTDLGLQFPDSVKKLAEGQDSFALSLSRENADKLNDIDLIVTYGDSSLLPTLQADPMLSQIPAIKNGAVAFIDSTTAIAGGATPSILSIPYNIDAYLTLLGDAAGKIK